MKAFTKHCQKNCMHTKLNQNLIASQIDSFFKNMTTRGLENDQQIHSLYAFIKAMPDDVIYPSMHQSGILVIMCHYVKHQEYTSMGGFWKPSQRTATYIIELIRINLEKSIQIQEARQSNMELCQEILGTVYRGLKVGYNQFMVKEIQTKILECLISMRKINKKSVSETNYAELLARTPSKIEEFIQLFKEYLGGQGNANYGMIGLLLEGFKLRLPSLIGSDPKDLKKMQFLQLYQTFVEFLSKLEPNSIWLRSVTEEEGSIIKAGLFELAILKYKPEEMAELMDKLISIYLKAQMSSIIRFGFILEILKFIIFRAAALFGMMHCTDEIQDSPLFLSWFVQTELKFEKQQEIIDVYLANTFSLEFMLLMMIFNIYHFPKEAPRLSDLMRSVNLLEEAKYFMTNADTRQFLLEFYRSVGEEDIYIEYENRVLDAATLYEL